MSALQKTPVMIKKQATSCDKVLAYPISNKEFTSKILKTQ